jgi:hypothetical protein
MPRGDWGVHLLIPAHQQGHIRFECTPSTPLEDRLAILQAAQGCCLEPDPRLAARINDLQHIVQQMQQLDQRGRGTCTGTWYM